MSVPSNGEATTRLAWEVRRRRRRIQVALGVLWLLDGALQLQPYMFSRAFGIETLQSTAGGNPAFVADPIRWVGGAVVAHPVAFNSVFALIQLALGMAMIWRKTARVALGVSVGWALAVWWLGEGLGGVLTGATSPLMGAPGAAVLYAMTALFLWPGRQTGAPSVAEAGLLGERAVRGLWLVLWGSLAIFFLQPGVRDSDAVGAMVRGMRFGEPHWLGELDTRLGFALDGRGLVVAGACAALCASSALVVLLGRRPRWVLIGAVLVATFIWVCENFGAVLTGSGTDPNSGPLLVLLVATLWPLSGSRRGAPLETSSEQATGGHPKQPAAAEIWYGRPSQSRAHVDVDIAPSGHEGPTSRVGAL